MTSTAKEELVLNPYAQVPITPSAEHRSLLEQRWLDTFGELPKDLPWACRAGKGLARLEEGLGSLVVNANRSVRLAQFGDLCGDLGKNDFQHRQVHLGMDLSAISGKGGFGFFFGFRQLADDPHRVAEFQAVEIIWPAESNAATERRKLLIRRCLLSIDGNGSANSERNVFESRLLSRTLTTVRLEVQLKGGKLAGVSLNGSNCGVLCTVRANSQFVEKEYRGPFGVCVEDAAIEVRNPTFNRIK